MATAPTKTILVVAAESREFAGILRHCSKTARIGLPVQFARTGELGGRRIVMVANGPGPALAGEAAALAIEKYGPEIAISAGFCGALDPALREGGIFVASTVDAVEQGRSFSGIVPQTAMPFATGRLLSMNRVARTVEEKRKLRATGASAVEMEAAAVALAAEKWSVPFSCLRVVTDRADEAFAIDFNEMRDAAGRFSRARIMRKAMARPAFYIPELLRIDRRSRSAAQILGGFFASCQF
jgi:adenosylhomocysteine nucleosidase